MVQPSNFYKLKPAFYIFANLNPIHRSSGAADTHRQAIHILRFNQVVHLCKAYIQGVAVDRHLH